MAPNDLICRPFFPHARRPRGLSALALVLAGLLLVGAMAPAAAVEVVGSIRLDPDTPAGADPAGRVLLYTPNPLEPGSSISHWDISARPDLLMEPAISTTLGFASLDLTLPLLQDMGWRRGGSNIVIDFADPPGLGFNDPTLGPARRGALQRVAEVWGGVLDSDVEIHVEAMFQSLSCDNTGAVLAQAGTQFLFESFPGAPVAGVWYHGALAESLAGQNLSLDDNSNPTAADIGASFNLDIDTGCLGQGSRFYYGLDGNIPNGQISFVNVALHEIGHGLGFASLVSPSGRQFMGMPDAYSRRIFDNDQGRTWDQMTNAERQASAINTGRVAWSGTRVTNAARGLLEPAPVLSIESPANIAGSYPAAPAQFGPALSVAGIAGGLVVARDGSANPTEACGPLVNGNAVRDHVALIDRGNCLFVEKVKNAQNAGAVGVVVINNVAGAPVAMGGTDASIVIPSIHIRQDDGALIKSTLAAGPVPPAPANLVAQSLGGGRVLLTWEDTASDETQHRVERRQGQGAFSQIAVLGPNVESFQDSGLTLGELYTYRVRSRNSNGFSAFSDPASVTVGDAPPLSPTGVDAKSLSGSEIEVTWNDASANEESFVVERREVAVRDAQGDLTFLDTPFVEVAELPAGTTSTVLGNLMPGTTYNVRVKARNQQGDSAPSAEAAATTSRVAGECTPGERTLCLVENRFEAFVFFKNQHAGGAPGLGTSVPGTDESGFFWFFDPTNLELVVKLLDATSFANAYWLFYGALSDVEYWIVVTDTASNEVNTYHNPPGNICGEADLQAFLVPVGGGATAPAAGFARRWQAAPVDPEAFPALAFHAATVDPVAPQTPQVAAGESGCVAGPETLCLLGDRFQVKVGWTNQRDGMSGVGMAIPSASSDATGFFWFFNPENVELVLKVLDGRGINGKFWVFYGALSDVEYEIEVVDTQTGNKVQYRNPPGNICGLGDTEALDG